MSHFDVYLSEVSDGSMLARRDPTNESVIANREKFLSRHNIDFNTAVRVDVNTLTRATVTYDANFCRYAEVSEEMAGDGMRDKASQDLDGLVTTRGNQALVLGVADCVGAVLFDPIKSVLMVSHLGRHSLEQNGAQRSVEYLVEHYGSTVKDIQVWLSPAPAKEWYQIWALDNKGMKEATLEQLKAAGIQDENITNDTRDTVTDLDFYSYSEFLKGNRKEDGDHMIVAIMRS